MAEAGPGIHEVAVIRAGLMGSAIAAHVANAGLPGPSARAAFEMAVEGFALADKATAHDRVVGRALAEVVSGGETDIAEEIGEKALMALERKAFMSLIKTPATLDRIEHMLETGRPLRN